MVSIDPQSFRRSAESLREYPDVALSFTAYKALTTLFMLIPIRTPNGIPAKGIEATAIPYIYVFLAVALWCIVFAAFGRTSRLFEKREYLWASGGLIILGLAVLSIRPPETFSPVTSIVLFVLGVVLLSGGYSAIHIEFGRLMGQLGMTYTLIFNIGCLILSIPIAAIALILPGLFQQAFILLVIACCTIFLDRSIEKLGRDKLYHGTDSPLSIPTRFMFTSFAQGVSVGLLFTVFSTPFIQSIWGESITGLAATLAALLFGLTLRIDFDRLIYRIGFACIGIGCALWALSGDSLVLRDVSSFFQLFAFTYLDIILWSLGSHLIKDRNQPALWVAACPTASLLIGRCTGGLLGTLSLSGTSRGGETLFSYDPTLAMAVIATFAFMLIAMQLSSGKNIENGWGFIKPNESNALSAIEQACALIAGDFHLTERESDVLRLLARGKTRKEISEELFVTQNTVKTHQRNLYNKLDVHSLDDLKKFVAHQQGAFISRADNLPPLRS